MKKTVLLVAAALALAGFAFAAAPATAAGDDPLAQCTASMPPDCEVVSVACTMSVPPECRTG